jgi:death-on-curing protein
MIDEMSDPLWYPSVQDILAIHDDIVTEYPETAAGIRDAGAIEFVVEDIQNRSCEGGTEPIHEKAFHLLRLLVANHPFVDANKRTALNTIVVFYFLNGYRFGYDEEIRSMLKRLATNEATVSESDTVEYLRSHTEEITLTDEIDQWRDELVRFGLNRLEDDRND